MPNWNLSKFESPGSSAQVLHPAFTEGVDLEELPVGARLEVETGHTRYVVENRGNGKVIISGHATFCPEPMLVEFHGSLGGQTLLKPGYIEPGLKMAFQHPELGVVRTSRVRSVRLAKTSIPS